MTFTAPPTFLGLAALLATAVAVVAPPTSPPVTSPVAEITSAATPDRPDQAAASGTPVPPARTAVVAPARPGAGFRPPLAGRPAIGRRFAVGPQRWSPGHRGVDLVAAPGSPVLAPGPGTVRFSGTVVSRGVLTLDHGGGLLTSYEPVRAALAAGTRVEPGDAIGSVTAAGGHCPVNCLHWGARQDGTYLDPLTLLAAWRGPPILLPVR
jgi:murein DD-endopeptidase MepM/ murein hydrolase activator NlpD